MSEQLETGITGRQNVIDAVTFRNAGSETMRDLVAGGDTKFYRVVLGANSKNATITTLDEEGGRTNSKGVVYVEVGRDKSGAVTGEIWVEQSDKSLRLISDDVLNISDIYDKLRELLLPQINRSGNNNVIGFVEAPNISSALH